MKCVLWKILVKQRKRVIRAKEQEEAGMPEKESFKNTQDRAEQARLVLGPGIASSKIE